MAKRGWLYFVITANSVGVSERATMSDANMSAEITSAMADDGYQVEQSATLIIIRRTRLPFMSWIFVKKS